MGQIIALIGFTFGGWLVHSLISSMYSSKFSSTKSLGFRLTHAFEIFILMAVTMLLYTHTVDPSITVLSALCSVLGTLLVLDSVALVLAKKLRARFDIGHFIFAYGAVIIAVAIVIALD